MRQVLLTALETELGGPGSLAAGAATFEYWAGDRPFVAVDSETVTLPKAITVAIVDGAAVDDLQLEETTDCCVRTVIRSEVTGSYLVRFVEIPAGTDPIPFGDLPVVDPATFAPADVTPTLQQTIESVARELFWDRI